MVSKKESHLTERIFMLQHSLRLLKQGYGPFNQEAIEIITRHIKELKGKK